MFRSSVFWMCGVCLPALVSLTALVPAYRGSGWSGWAVFGFVVALTATPVVIVRGLRLVALVAPVPKLVRVVLVLGGYVGLLVFFIAIRGNDDQRCVETGSMTVVATSNCTNPTAGSTGGPDHPVYMWYYGGAGARIGDPATGGSFSSPGEDSGGDTGGGSGGDDVSVGGEDGE